MDCGGFQQVYRRHRTATNRLHNEEAKAVIVNFRFRTPNTIQQNTIMKIIARIGAILAFTFCLLGGLWILSRANIASKDDILGTAIGFYFVGKAFFVGPMLWLAGEKCCSTPDGK